MSTNTPASEIKVTRNIKAKSVEYSEQPVELPDPGVLYVFDVSNWDQRHGFYDRLLYSFGVPSTQKQVFCNFLNCKVMHYERTCQGVYYCPGARENDSDNSDKTTTTEAHTTPNQSNNTQFIEAEAPNDTGSSTSISASTPHPCKMIKACRYRYQACSEHKVALTKSGPCRLKLHFYIPVDSTDNRRLLLCIGEHNHVLIDQSTSSKDKEKDKSKTQQNTFPVPSAKNLKTISTQAPASSQINLHSNNVLSQLQLQQLQHHHDTQNQAQTLLPPTSHLIQNCHNAGCCYHNPRNSSHSTSNNENLPSSNEPRNIDSSIFNLMQFNYPSIANNNTQNNNQLIGNSILPTISLPLIPTSIMNGSPALSLDIQNLMSTPSHHISNISKPMPSKIPPFQFNLSAPGAASTSNQSTNTSNLANTTVDSLSTQPQISAGSISFNHANPNDARFSGGFAISTPNINSIPHSNGHESTKIQSLDSTESKQTNSPERDNTHNSSNHIITTFQSFPSHKTLQDIRSSPSDNENSDDGGLSKSVAAKKNFTLGDFKIIVPNQKKSPTRQPNASEVDATIPIQAEYYNIMTEVEVFEKNSKRRKLSNDSFSSKTPDAQTAGPNTSQPSSDTAVLENNKDRAILPSISFLLNN